MIIEFTEYSILKNNSMTTFHQRKHCAVNIENQESKIQVPVSELKTMREEWKRKGYGG